MTRGMDKDAVLRTAAEEFTEKARELSTVLEIALVGSVAGGDPYPGDLDLAVVVRNLDELAILARYARQMSRYHSSWDVFLFDESLASLGRVCHRRECPGESIDCYVPGCGRAPHLRVHPGFEYDERTFLTSPIEVLWTSFKSSRLLARKEELGISESRKYPVLKDVELECIICGKTFVFTGGSRNGIRTAGLAGRNGAPTVESGNVWRG